MTTQVNSSAGRDWTVPGMPNAVSYNEVVKSRLANPTAAALTPPVPTVVSVAKSAEIEDLRAARAEANAELASLRAAAGKSDDADHADGESVLCALIRRQNAGTATAIDDNETNASPLVQNALSRAKAFSASQH